MRNSDNITALTVHKQFQRLAVYFGVLLSLVMFCCVLVYGTAVQSAVGDADLDSVPDTVDIDDDNDGIPDRYEITHSGADRDSDADGMPDRLDLDSDNDGILDLEESGLLTLPQAVQLRFESGRVRAQMGRNGFADLLETGQDNGQLAYQLLNTDINSGDTLPDYLDLDSDNDGLLDIHEAGVSLELDRDGDGRIDAQPGEVGADGILDSVQLQNDTTCCDYSGDGREDLTPRNTDGGDFPDFQDHDSDNDGIVDLVEAGGRDLNGDGFVDGFLDNPQDPDGIDDAFLVVPLTPGDSNGNGVPDYLDVSTQYIGDNAGPANQASQSGPVLIQPEPTQSGSSPAQPAPVAPEDSTEQIPAAPSLAEQSGEPELPDESILSDTQGVEDAPAASSSDPTASATAVLNTPIETGLAGNGGCTLVTNTDTVDPLLPLTALLAFGYTISRRQRTPRVDFGKYEVNL